MARILGPLLLGGPCLLVAACGDSSPPALPALTVLTRNAPTTLYQGTHRREGFEHDLAVEFGRYLQLPVQFQTYDTPHEVLDALAKGKGDLAAAALIRDDAMQEVFLYGPGYMEVEQQVVCRTGGDQPRTLAELPRIRLKVAAGTAHEARLRELLAQMPELSWETDQDSSSEQILEEVWRGQVDCTVEDSNVVELNRRYFPDLTVAFALGPVRTLAWVLPREKPELHQRLLDWFRVTRENGQLERIYERYFSHLHYTVFDPVDHRTFLYRIQSRLPRFQPLFQEAQERYGVPWKLLAALAYQESHWDPASKSPTGVKGLMMLTRSTAKEIGVKNRENVGESIRGGALHLSRILKELSPEIMEPDRTWIALAAYNVGIGHLADARALCRKFGKDPNLWQDLKTVLPLLSQERYYARLEYGYARGAEPVLFVQRIRDFLDILEKWGDRKDEIIPTMADDTEEPPSPRTPADGSAG